MNLTAGLKVFSEFSIFRRSLRPVCGAMAAGAAVSLSLSAGSAEAYVVTVNGQQYNITTTQTTYTDGQALLQSQPWWGASGAAYDFAVAVGKNLGVPNFGGGAGPIFIHSAPPATLNVAYQPALGINQNTAQFGTLSATDYPFYAVATPVPAPLTILGAGAALASVRRLRAMSQRLHRSPEA